MKPKIYLSYAMQFVADEEAQKKRADTVRQELQKLGFEVYNPYTDEEHIFKLCGCSNRQDFIDLQKSNFKQFMQCMRKIKQHDINHLESSDLVVALIDPVTSGGLAGEVTLASYEAIPVYGIVDPQNYKNISGWVLSCCDIMFDNLDELIDQLKKDIEHGFYS